MIPKQRTNQRVRWLWSANPASAAELLRLAGLAVHGGRNDVDKVLKGLPLHP
ncbi:hypothetical protein ACQP1V_19930 [Microtetraspora malaysiensis]|uniref:hypothetical protein n=1 Tax=Microtetraspora malaysiensis TaxID=161358 RepID=UPI003D8E10F0